MVNRETLVVVMLEAPKAIANAEKMVAVNGVDVLLIKTNSLYGRGARTGEHAAGHQALTDGKKMAMRNGGGKGWYTACF